MLLAVHLDTQLRFRAVEIEIIGSGSVLTAKVVTARLLAQFHPEPDFGRAHFLS